MEMMTIKYVNLEDGAICVARMNEDTFERWFEEHYLECNVTEIIYD